MVSLFLQVLRVIYTLHPDSVSKLQTLLPTSPLPITRTLKSRFSFISSFNSSTALFATEGQTLLNKTLDLTF